MAHSVFSRHFAVAAVTLLGVSSAAQAQSLLPISIKIVPISKPSSTQSDQLPRSIDAKSASISSLPLGIATGNRIYIPPSLKSVELRIFALAGHRNFDTLRHDRTELGWSVTSNNNALGIGTTATYGVKVSERTRLVPFLSMDYNRIDSARYANARSPRPYLTDNADTGFAGSAGALIWHSLDSNGTTRIAGYAGVTMTAGTLTEKRETGTLAGRILQTLGDNGPLHARGEFGLAANAQLSRDESIRAGVIQTYDPVAGNSAAATLSYQFKF